MKPETRNPVLALPSVDALRGMDAEVRTHLRAVLLDLGTDAASRAQHCWKRHKAPMACYWKAVSVYARHIARAIK